jgi:hypothetical protein
VINARQRPLWEISVARPAPATPREGIGPSPRTSINPSAVLSTTEALVIIKGIRGSFTDRNTPKSLQRWDKNADNKKEMGAKENT